MKEKVKDYIKEKRGLKRLEFGCEIEDLTKQPSVKGIVLGDDYNGTFVVLGVGQVEVRKLLDKNNYKIIGLEPKFNDYLAVLSECPHDWFLNDRGGLVYQGEYCGEPIDLNVKFSLDTGEPATDKDWKLLAEILDIK